MKIRVDYAMAAASHMGIFTDVVEVHWKVALRLWRSCFSRRVFTSSDDWAGNQLLERILQTANPQYRYPVSAIFKVRPALKGQQ